jgi:hypothetical protein
MLHVAKLRDDAGEAVGYGRKLRKRRVWLRLTPVGDGVVVVAAVVCVAVLDGGAQRFRKRDRRIEMKAIHGPARAWAFRSDDRSAEQPVSKLFSAKIPRAEKIVLRTSAIDRRKLFATDEEHVVASPSPHQPSAFSSTNIVTPAKCPRPVASIQT